MATRRERVGSRIHGARQRAGLTLSTLSKRTGISVPSLSRFEADKREPSFSQACMLARALGVPLLLLAAGRDRSGEDPRDITAHLVYWGLSDIALRDMPLIGEARPIEELIANALGPAWRPRVIEGVPGLLLKAEFNVAELVARCRDRAVLHRLGWLAEIAEWISTQISVEYLHPSAALRVRQVRADAWKHRQAASKTKRDDFRDHWDIPNGGFPEPPDDAGISELEFHGMYLERRLKADPPITTKWWILYETPQKTFLSRARSILEVSGE